MASTPSALKREAASPRRATGKSEPTPQSLGVVDRRRVVERARRRQARMLLVVSAGLVSVALVVAAAGHALLAATQLRADNLQSAVSGALTTEQNLEVQRATLETPSRILAIAEQRLKMVLPSGVAYLEPVSTGPSVLRAHEAGSAHFGRSTSSRSR